MRVFTYLAATFTFMLLFSCASTAIFPVSQATPAATITAKIRKQAEPNYLIAITAINLASPERLIPAKKVYVIWAISEHGFTRNAGHFTHTNATKATYKASFPYKPIAVFITAEDEENIFEPAGIEISRIKLQSK